MRTRPILLALAVTVALLPGPAPAHDHSAPDALLVTASDSGEGTNYTTTWSTRRGDLCAVLHGDGTGRYEEPPVTWVPGTAIAVRFETRHRPARVAVTGYVAGDPLAGIPLIGGDPVPHELRKVEVDGKTMWEAALSPPPSPDLYLDVVAHWRDTEGCGMQESAWTFRAGLLPI
ncbi:MAG TPA: hypothetical protein VHN37_06265 [Actinomycetota bacterium]|nr:hypothetical protein [Actinomycetota bacterium]